MCNRFRQAGGEIRPGQKAFVWFPETRESFSDAVFAGCARNESKHYWLKKELAEEVIVPASSFSEKNKTTGVQTWEDIPPGQVMQGLLLPQEPEKTYRVLKVITREASAVEWERFGNNRVPLLIEEPSGLPPQTDEVSSE